MVHFPPVFGAELVELARVVAREMHAGVLDRGKQPYIDHPAWVASRLDKHDHLGRAVAWLHDVVEDTSVTLQDLRGIGVPEVVLAAVDAITKRPGEEKLPYYRRVAANPIAYRVKLADLEHNSNLERMARIKDPATRLRLTAKYAMSSTQLYGFRREHVLAARQRSLDTAAPR